LLHPGPVETYGGNYLIESIAVTCWSSALFALRFLLLDHIILESLATFQIVEIFGTCLRAATMQQPGPSSGSIPLTECRREVPPGWGPSIPDYTLRSYFEKLRPWYKVFDGADEIVGLLVGGRVIGR